LVEILKFYNKSNWKPGYPGLPGFEMTLSDGSLERETSKREGYSQ
jgi:hypothetical protein